LKKAAIISRENDKVAPSVVVVENANQVVVCGFFSEV